MSEVMVVWHAILAVVSAADTYTLAAAVVIIIAAGFLSESLGSLLSTTILSLVVFAAAKYVLAIAVGHQSPAGFALADWHAFLDLKMLTFLAYVIVFGVLIAVVNVIRSAFR